MPTSPDTSSATFQVSSPFNTPTYADILLKSADDDEFHVLRANLALASPVFASMFSILRAPTDADARPKSRSLFLEVPLTETSPVLDNLLRRLYPGRHEPFTDVKLAMDVLIAAEKYELQVILPEIRQEIRDMVERNPKTSLQVYAIACLHKLEEQVRMAAYTSLKAPLLDTDPAELQMISGTTLFSLIKYREAIKDKVLAIFQREPALSPELVKSLRANHYSSYGAMHCPGARDSIKGNPIYPWWLTYCDVVQKEIKKAPLADNILTRAYITDLTSRAHKVSVPFAPPTCDQCIRKLYHHWESLEDGIRAEMHRLASEVSILT